VWLSELRGKYRQSIRLGSVSAAEWDAIGDMGFDAVWLMGVWERNPAGIAITIRNDQLLQEFRRALPDFRLEDVIGSPYCVSQYAVAKHLGGNEWSGERAAGTCKARDEADAGFRPESCCPGSFVGKPSARLFCPRDR
jgi:hypothetical protein